MTLAGRLRARRYAPAIEQLSRAMERDSGADARCALQLTLLNREWARSRAEVPWYAQLCRERDLPERFASIDQFTRLVPIVRREDVQRQLAAMSSQARAAEWFRITGGSTAAPVQLPAWESERAATRDAFWVARSWYGVDPASRLFLLWGHSHLLGSGWRAWVRARRLEWSDRLLGYQRFSAYDLRPEAMQAAGRALLRFRPDYLLGYSTALDLFARANQSRREELRRAGLRLVVATAESFPAPDSEARLRDLFGCPVAMEYGAVETGVIAHGHPDGGYRVFWHAHLVEGAGEGDRRRVLITSLYPRAFPLVRYEIGDEIDLDPADHSPSLAGFRRVVGRSNDYASLSDGTLVHSEAFSHAVRPCAAIRGYQVAQTGSEIRLRFTSDRELGSSEVAGIRERLRRVHRELESIPFDRMDALDQTVAGKTRMVIRS